MVNRCEIGQLTQRSPKRLAGWFALFLKLPLMIIALDSQFCVYLSCLGASLAQCLYSGLKCESSSMHFQPGEGPSRGLLRDCENIADGSCAALVPGLNTRCSTMQNVQHISAALRWRGFNDFSKSVHRLFFLGRGTGELQRQPIVAAINILTEIWSLLSVQAPLYDLICQSIYLLLSLLRPPPLPSPHPVHLKILMK